MNEPFFPFVKITRHAVQRLKERSEEFGEDFPENLESFFRGLLRMAYKVRKPTDVELKYPFSLDHYGKCYYYRSNNGWYFVSKKCRNQDGEYLSIFSVFKRNRNSDGLPLLRKYRWKGKGRKKRKIFIKGDKGKRFFPSFEEIRFVEVDENN